MRNEPRLIPEALLASEVRAICQRYRIDADEAREILDAHFAKHPGLAEEIAKRHPDEDVTRLRAYKRVLKDARKQIYYHLRRYQRDHEQRGHLAQQLERLVHAAAGPEQLAPVIARLLTTHVSTGERAPHCEAFYRQLYDLIDPPRSILDVGCGLHPMSYPFHRAAVRPDVYLALDRSADAIHALRVFAPCAQPTRLIPVCADLAEVHWPDLLPVGLARFEVAFLLKLVPVVHRTHRDLLGRLVEVPARRIVVSASSEALTRREDIRRREERVLHAFIEMTGRPVTGTFEIGNEFGYVLGAPA